MQHTPRYRPTATDSNQPTMKDYNASFIYKITNGVQHYYGSSCDTFDNRKRGHTSSSNLCTSKKIINSGLPWTMDIIEMFPCSCLEQLEDREAYWIMNNECVNEHVPGAIRRAGGTKAYNKKKCAQYYEDNKKKCAQYYEDNKEALKEKQKQRYEDNKEAIKEKQKQRYADNKEAINEKQKIKHNCDVCGGKYTAVNKMQHFKTKKHQKAIADAVAVHAPTQPQTINNNTINCEVCNVTQ
jgi:hypothetical protein